jgi:hypothetical protein
MDLHINSLLKRIDFQPIATHKHSLYEFLRFELYDVPPKYYWSGDTYRMPRYYSFVLKQIRQLE